MVNPRYKRLHFVFAAQIYTSEQFLTSRSLVYGNILYDSLKIVDYEYMYAFIRLVGTYREIVIGYIVAQ